MARVGDELAEGVIRQEADGVCEEAEDEAHQDVRDAFLRRAGGGGALEFELLGESEEVAGGGLSDGRRRHRVGAGCNRRRRGAGLSSGGRAQVAVSRLLRRSSRVKV